MELQRYRSAIFKDRTLEHLLEECRSIGLNLHRPHTTYPMPQASHLNPNRMHIIIKGITLERIEEEWSILLQQKRLRTITGKHWRLESRILQALWYQGSHYQGLLEEDGRWEEHIQLDFLEKTWVSQQCYGWAWVVGCDWNVLFSQHSSGWELVDSQ